MYATRDKIPTGVDILHNPSLNKATAFTEAERDALKIRGLLPPRVFSQSDQVRRVLENFRSKPSNIEKYIFLIALQDRNERLFFRAVIDHIEEMMPVVYTPTVGEACTRYAHIFRRPRGLYLSLKERGRVAEVMRNWPESDVRAIVVTDGERILGLGDLGANGMGIPIGKLNLYTACAGIPPSLCMPVALDVGTENREFLEDPLYIGTLQRRLRGPEYDAFLEEFVDAVQEVFPKALIQFEDFAQANALRLLREYKDRVCAFNDDIQGTGAVTLAGLLSGGRLAGRGIEEQTLLFQGAGSAAAGIADLFVHALMMLGIHEEEARRRCWLVDTRGLVVEGRGNLPEHKRPYAHPHEPLDDLLAAVKALRPTALIGVSGAPGTFTQPVVEAMAQINERPLIFALSNPTSKSECTAEEAYRWTRGRAIFASGSPFPPVEYEGRAFVPSQGNNAYIFPGVGLGVIASGASRVTESMFFAAAATLAAQVSQDCLEEGRIYPPLSAIRDVSLQIAVAVAEVAHEENLAREPLAGDLRATIAATMFEPDYPDFA